MPPTTPSATARSARTTATALDAATETTIDLSIAQRVRRGHVAERDRDDLAQHLRCVVLEALPDYCPQTASWSTFVGTVLQRAIFKWLRHHRCACRQHTQSVSLFTATGACTEAAERCTASQATDPAVHLVESLSFADALAALTTEDRRIAELLMGHTPAAVLRLTGWSKARFYRAAARIRKAFRQAGFGAP